MPKANMRAQASSELRRNGRLISCPPFGAYPKNRPFDAACGRGTLWVQDAVFRVLAPEGAPRGARIEGRTPSHYSDRHVVVRSSSTESGRAELLTTSQPDKRTANWYRAWRQVRGW